MGQSRHSCEPRLRSGNSDAFEPPALAELLRWGFDVLGDGWGDGVPVDAIVAEYLASPSFQHEQWPAFGLELHLPSSAGAKRRADLCLLRFDSPRRIDVPRQWCEAPVKPPGLTYSADFAFAEYDILDGRLRPMGHFRNVVGGGGEVWPEGPLRKLHRLCGAPRIIGLTPGRGDGVSAVLFQLEGAAWHEVPELLETEMRLPGLACRIRALKPLHAEGVIVRVGVSATQEGRLVPRGGLELSGLIPNDSTTKILVEAGASAYAVNAWSELCQKLPQSERIDRPLQDAPALELPWQRRVIQNCHLKLGLQEGEGQLKLYVRIDGIPADETFLNEKLRSVGLQDSAIRLLATLRADARRGADGPDQDSLWWAALRQDLPEAAWSWPFVPLFWPILRAKWNRMVNELGPDILRRIDPSACDDLLIAGLKRLIEELGPSLHHAWRGSAAGTGERLLVKIGVFGAITQDEKDVELAWCHAQLRNGLDMWLAGQPVAAGRLVRLVEDWASATCGMLRRIAFDWSDLIRVFDLRSEYHLTAVLTDLGDRHAFGNSVNGLIFGSGGETRRICYKPRSLEPERCWQDHWQCLTAGLPTPPPPAPLQLDLGTHGYMSWLDASPPVTEDEASHYCRNAGRMLALLHVLGAGDVHVGNIISRPEGPVIVDAELLFDGNHGPWIDEADDVAAPLWRDTVLSTGMLPSRLRNSFTGWVDLVVPEVLRNSAALEAGFREMSEIVIARTLEVQGAIAKFAALPRRLLLRSTHVYATLLAALRSPEALTSAKAARACLAPLQTSKSVSTRAGRALIAAEERALERGDFPLFLLRGTDIHEGTLRSPVVTDWAGGCEGVARAHKRLVQLRTDLNWQANLLALASAGLGRWPRRSCRKETESDRLAATVAHWVRDCLVSEVNRHPQDGHLLWLTWRWEPTLGIQTVAEMLPGLYSGHYGALAFLAAWSQGRPHDREAAAIQSEMTPALGLSSMQHGYGLDGMAGNLRLSFCLGQPLKLDAKAVAHMLDLDASPNEIDFVSGCAGMLSALSWYKEAASHAVATDLASQLAGHCMRASDLAEPGLAHGRCGLAIAMIAAGQRWANKGWLNSGATWLSQVVDQNGHATVGWHNGIEGQTSPTSGWCRGSAGIALALGRALTLAPDHCEAPKWRDGLSSSVRLVLGSRADAIAATPLCCGSIGTAVVLQILGAEHDNPVLIEQGRARLDIALRVWPEQAAGLPIGLMDGISGIGLSALWRGAEARRFLPFLV